MREIYIGRLPVDEDFYWTVDCIERLSKVKFTIDPRIKEIADRLKKKKEERMKGGTYHATQER